MDSKNLNPKSGDNVAAGTMKQRPLEEISEITSTLNLGVENSEGYWAINVPYFPVGDGGVSVTVIDERSKININAQVDQGTNRVDQQVLTELRELFRFLGIDEGKSERFIASLINWLDAPVEEAINDQDSLGAQGQYYSRLENPYLIKDGSLDSLQEILLIDGMDEEFYTSVKDFVTIFPDDKKINFSTAPKVVIMAAIKAATISAIQQQEPEEVNEVPDDTAEQIADEIIAARAGDPILTQQRARQIASDVDTTSEISAGLVGVAHNTGQSDTFTVKSIGSLGEVNPTKRIVEAVLRKTTLNNSPVVDIVSWKEL